MLRNEPDTTRFLGALLRTGVVVAGSIVVLGAVIYLARHGGERPDYRVFRGEPAVLRSVWGILSESVALRGRAIIQFGLVVLIATPVVRVACSVCAFAREHDRKYVAVTLIVLGLLLFSLFGAAA